MKALLAVMLAGVMVGVVGCNTNFQPVGTPTVSISVPKSSLVNTPKAIPDPADSTKTITVDDWNLIATIEVRTLPGSPAGTVGNFVLQGGGVLATSVSTDPCPVPTATESSLCGPFTIDYSLGFGRTQPSTNVVKIVSYTVSGNNGLSAVVTANPPITVY